MAGTKARFAAKTEHQLLKALRDRHSALVHSAESLRFEATEACRMRDVSDMLDHEDPAADFDTETMLILAERAERLLLGAEQALCRASSGTYGTCVSCGVRIPVARLRLLPAAAMCVECSQLSSNSGRHDGSRPRGVVGRSSADSAVSVSEVV